MSFFFIFLSFLWFIRETKAILFWLYLWQLKEYRFDRFFDYFRTYQGKKLFFNFFFIFKIILFLWALFLAFYPKLLALQLYVFWIVILAVIYFFEGAKTVLDFFQKKLKKPVLTQKGKTLILVSLIIEFLFLFILFQKIELFYWFSFSLLSFDILTPFVVSGIVLLFQPLTVYLQNKIIKKAKEKRAKIKDLIVIGITGSYGKTSTKEFLNTILSSKFKVLSTPANQNTDIAIAQLILKKLTQDIEIFIVEMAAYKKGEITSPCQIVKPKIGIITGINEQHLATFGSMENLLSAEGGLELIESLSGDGMVFFNAKNKYCLDIYQATKIKKRLYGKEAKFFGEENILGAVAVARELGMTEEEISRAVEKIENKLPGIQQKGGINGLIIFDATYSANPDGVIGHLEYLKTFSGKKIIVMPCLIELGKASKEVHKRIGRKIGEVCDLAIITTKDRFKEIKEGAVKRPEIIFLENPKEIFEKIRSFCAPRDVVLLESRVPAELISLLVAEDSPHLPEQNEGREMNKVQ